MIPQWGPRPLLILMWFEVQKLCLVTSFARGDRPLSPWIRHCVDFTFRTASVDVISDCQMLFLNLKKPRCLTK